MVIENNVWRMILKSCGWRLILKCFVWFVSGGRQTQCFETLRLAGTWRVSDAMFQNLPPDAIFWFSNVTPGNVLKSHVRRNVSKSGARRKISKSSARRNFLWPCVRHVSWLAWCSLWMPTVVSYLAGPGFWSWPHTWHRSIQGFSTN